MYTSSDLTADWRTDPNQRLLECAVSSEQRDTLKVLIVEVYKKNNHFCKKTNMNFEAVIMNHFHFSSLPTFKQWPLTQLSKAESAVMTTTIDTRWHEQHPRPSCSAGDRRTVRQSTVGEPTVARRSLISSPPQSGTRSQFGCQVNIWAKKPLEEFGTERWAQLVELCPLVETHEQWLISVWTNQMFYQPILNYLNL